MGEEHTIRTQIDVLLSALQEATAPLGTRRLAQICGMRERDVVKWAHVLEQGGKVRIENRLGGVCLSWAEPSGKKLPPLSPTAVYVGGQPAFDADIEIAKRREEEAKGAPRREKVEVEPSSAVEVGGARLGRTGDVLRGLGAKEGETLIDAIRREAESEEEAVATEVEGKPAFAAEPLEERKRAGAGDGAAEGEEAAAAGKGADAKGKERAPAEEESAAQEESRSAEEEEEGGAAEGNEEESAAQEENWESAGGGISLQPRIGVPKKSIIRPRFRRQEAGRKKIERIKRPEPVMVTGVSLQFSERLARQMRRIERQAREIDALRQGKEKLLSEHYLPLQHKLEAELETISDRVLRMQSRVAGLQKQAADLPSQVSGVEKAQATSIKAHGDMRRAYDEACALLEESGKSLAEEREKMELLLQQSREELSRHTTMSSGLAATLGRVEEMEGEAERRVSEARAALSEQAQRLAAAEMNADELGRLRSEIGENVAQMRREVAAAKRVLGDLERQMGQMRQIEDYSETIRKDYDAKMSEIDDYIRNGNREFETLRESVEANFVRRYLRELRALSESYSFEFGQVRRMEGDIDARIAEERRKLEQLFEEGKKISYLFETQSAAPADAGKFERHAEAFGSLEGVSSQRSQIAQMIAQVIGGKTESLPRGVHIPVSRQGAQEGGKPQGIAKIAARTEHKAKARRQKAARARKARKAKPAKMAKATKAAKGKGRKRRLYSSAL